MTIHIQPFAFGDQLVRVVHREGDPWFVAKDVCAALGLGNHRMAVEKLDEDEKGVSSTDTLGGAQEMLIVSESGLYTLILRCRDAVTPGTAPHRFRKWVTAEVLPSIRKTGKYEASAPDPDEGLGPIGDLNAKMRMVELAEKVKGKSAARALWAHLGLPSVPITSGGGNEIDRFLAACTEPDPSGRVAARALYEAYAEWARANELTPLTETSFGREATKRLGRVNGRKGRRYLGIRLTSP